MSNNGEHIIQQTKFLGINLYKRTRIEEHEIQVIAQQNITKYSGLLVASAHLPFSPINPNWEMKAHSTLELALLDLIINDFVELIVFTDNKSYLSDLSMNEYKNYRLAIKNEYLGEDILPQSIIDAIKYAERNKGKRADLEAVIRYLLDGYLDRNKKHNNPEKAFITALFRRYDHKYSWVTLEVHDYILYPSKIELDITAQKQKELNKSHQILLDILNAIKKESRPFSLYTNIFYRVIYSEFERREPNSR